MFPGNLELMEFEHETPTALIERRTAKRHLFQARRRGLAEVEADYDIVIIDCPPQLGYLTLGAVCAATSLLITIHPQMVDVASMSQFLLMTSDLLSVVRNAGGDLNHDFIRYVITRHEPHDGPQAQIVALLRSLFGDEVLAATVLKSTAIADAGLTKQTLYEIEHGQVRRSTYDRAIESLDAVNGEILDGIKRAWGGHEQAGQADGYFCRYNRASWPRPTFRERATEAGCWLDLCGPWALRSTAWIKRRANCRKL